MINYTAGFWYIDPRSGRTLRYIGLASNSPAQALRNANNARHGMVEAGIAIVGPTFVIK